MIGSIADFGAFRKLIPGHVFFRCILTPGNYWIGLKNSAHRNLGHA